MENLDVESILNASLQRCMQKNNFMEIFHEHFVNSSPEIKKLFQNTNLDNQFDMMSRSLMSMIAASEANWLNDQELVELSQKHKNMDINATHFALWEKSLLESIEKCDPEFDENVSSAWKGVIQRGKQFMMDDN